MFLGLQPEVATCLRLSEAGIRLNFGRQSGDFFVHTLCRSAVVLQTQFWESHLCNRWDQMGLFGHIACSRGMGSKPLFGGTSQTHEMSSLCTEMCSRNMLHVLAPQFE